MIRIGLIFFSLTFGLSVFLSCNKAGKGSDATAKPKLNKEQMVDLLIDIHLTEAALRIKPAEAQQNDIYTSHYYSAVFKKHKTTKEEFNASMLFYKDDLPALNDIYMQVVDSLSRMQGPPPEK